MKALNLPTWCYKTEEVLENKQLTVKIEITRLGKIWIYILGVVYYFEQYFKK